MWNDKWSAEGLSLFGRANFDLSTLMAESMAATVPGVGISAAVPAMEPRPAAGL